MKIERLGRYLDTDATGHIVPDVACSHIQGEWRDLIQKLLAELSACTGVSTTVYLRGSVPRGLAIRGVSDIDMVVLTPDPHCFATHCEKVIVAALAAQSVCTGIEYQVYPSRLMAALFEESTPKPAVYKVLKTGGLCVLGADMTAGLPAVRLDSMLGLYSQSILADWTRCERIAMATTHSAVANDAASWFARRFLRAAFEVHAMVRLQKYTRDLYLCWEATSDASPSHKQELWDVLEVAVGSKHFSVRTALGRLQRAVACMELHRVGRGQAESLL